MIVICIAIGRELSGHLKTGRCAHCPLADVPQPRRKREGTVAMLTPLLRAGSEPTAMVAMPFGFRKVSHRVTIVDHVTLTIGPAVTDLYPRDIVARDRVGVVLNHDA